MYSMVILDDEKIVLQGIQKLCQKEDFGFVIKGAFVDSLKALDALPGLRPHLIITDVRMPQMDGLEFARRAKEILPERTGDFNQSLMELGATVCPGIVIFPMRRLPCRSESVTIC